MKKDNTCRTYKVIDADYTPKFKVGEIIAKCYVQPYATTLCYNPMLQPYATCPRFYSLSTGIQQFAYYEDLEKVK